MNIIYLFEGAFSLWRRRLRGVYAQAREIDWHVEPINVDGEEARIQDMLRFWRPDGMIVDGAALSRSGVSLKDTLDMPVVYCDVDDEFVPESYYGVRHDSCAAAQAVLDELISLRRMSYGYVHHFVPRDWSYDRERLFLRRAGTEGLRAEVFDACEAFRKVDAKTFFRKLSRFLVDLPRPCGIFAANDEMGVHVIEAANAAGLRVPEDVAVAGIDDDDLLCENSVPTLTSVAPDFEASGRLAVRLIAKCIRERGRHPEIVTYDCAPLVRRQSTRAVTVYDPCVVRALEYIRLNACSGVSVADAVKAMGLKVRTGENRFLVACGHSIRDEILAVRVREAKRLLTDTDIPVSLVAEKCGYGNERSLRYIFAKATGVSPVEWRRRRGAGE
jgi:LacI family transcriptional regulator